MQYIFAQWIQYNKTLLINNIYYIKLQYNEVIVLQYHIIIYRYNITN